MQAVILAGGVGSRLEKAAGGRPKCLVEIGGRPLILHQLDALADHGVGPVLMVVGYQHDAIRDVVGQRVEYVVNERFAATNSLYSLRLARDWVTGPFVMLNGDLFFDPEILSWLLEESGSVLAYDSTSSRGREQTKVAIRERRVVDAGKDLPTASARGESLGLLRLDADGARAMFAVADELFAAGHERAWVVEAVRGLCRTVPLYGVNVAGLAWTEVDFPHDLAQARREVWPAIWRGRWRRVVYWRRTRWVAAAVLASVLALGGWFASTRVGPASIDWENVGPANVRRVVLGLATGRQRWWLVPPGDTATVRIEDGGPIRIEVRLLLSPENADGGRYVVAVTLDGEPHDWSTFTATPDSAVVFPEAVVGDRDRIELDLPPGPRQLGVSLLAGHGDRFLVRIRRPE